MGNFNRIYSTWISNPLCAIHERVRKLNPVIHWKKILFSGNSKAIFSFTVAVFSGINLYPILINKVKTDFSNDHPPSLELLRDLMTLKGRHQLKEPEKIENILSRFYIPLDDTLSVWISDDRHWITITPGTQFESTLVFGDTDLEKSVPKKWDWLGESWIGLQNIVKLKKSNPVIPITKKKFKRKTAWAHPREIKIN